MRHTIYASFTDVDLARKAAGALLDKGLEEENLTLISRHAGDEAGEAEKSAKHGITTTTGKDAASGAAKGAAVGLGVGAVAALAAIAVPGFGLVAGGGALATAIAGGIGTVAGGAIAGGVMGYLQDQGVETHIAEQYAADIEEEGGLLAVDIPSGNVDEALAREVFDKYGGRNVHVQATEPVGVSG